MRSAGILAHPTALPGPGPCGDLGDGATQFVDWLAECGVGIWQVLPLHPTGGGFSPYDSPTAFAGGTHLLSLAALADDGLISAEMARPPRHDRQSVNLAAMQAWHQPAIDAAATALALDQPDRLRTFTETHHWADDWALYRALLRAHSVNAWQDLPPALAHRQPDALARARDTHAMQIDVEVALQVLFDRQWTRLAKHARRRGVQILGDVPIFVSSGGADVWANPARFRGAADADGRWRPHPLAGAPPDDFTPLGQLWGNPHYDWEVHAREGYRWWVDRLRNCMRMVDRVRIDHFRGLVAAWAVPTGAPDATGGAWEPGPGRALFDAIAAALPDAPILVEDLGDITPDVHELRDSLSLPGMKILQFAFDGDPNHPFKPHNFGHSNWVAYTGTHDNDTAVGWYDSADQQTRHRFRVYAARPGDQPHWDLIRLAWGSVADTAVAQLQDVMGLGSDARFNTPGGVPGCWLRRSTRLPGPAESQRLAQLTALFGRRAGRPPPPPHRPQD